ncbi:Lipid-A-disaccharide synthase [bioreactor metagenome]|uniref:lipid-A-disaccharide synthase n=1 Tax=bioreactor metagenome TaxID=1076179 RepID=A0A644WMQ9_9ZZZZ
MKYFIIAGEASGDLHGSNLVKQLKARDNQAEIQGWGGDRMQQEGAEVKKHIRDLAFMGFVEVLLNIRTIMRNFRLCKSQVEQFKPDALILIDYPGFNLRMAKWALENKIRVIYYISPQVWAWKKSRVKTIRKTVDEMFTILPFEKDFYAKHGMDVRYEGHPLIDAVENFRNNTTSNQIQDGEKPILALLPGSRKQELKKMFPLMLKASDAFAATHRIVIGAVSLLPEELYETEGRNIEIVKDQTYPLLTKAQCAFVTSGTATLETALFRVPLVVCYKANPLSYRIAKMLVGKNIQFISLVNLIAGKEICRELIQGDLTCENMVAEMKKLIPPHPGRDQMLSEYELLYAKLGGPGASARVANEIIKICQS